GTCAFSAPRDADADAAGNIYVANYKVNNVVKFTATGSCTTAWGTTGTGDGQFRALYGVRLATDPVLGAQAVYVADANNNRFQEPRGIAFDASGVVTVADTVHHRIVRMNPDGTIINTCGVRGSATGQFNWPRGVAVDQATGEIWVANTKQYNLHIIKPDCTP